MTENSINTSKKEKEKEKDMKLTKEQLEKAKAAKSVEELLTLAKENGMELTEEEAAKHFAEWHKEGELADEELDNVSGAGCPYELCLAHEITVTLGLTYRSVSSAVAKVPQIFHAISAMAPKTMAK